MKTQRNWGIKSVEQFDIDLNLILILKSNYQHRAAVCDNLITSLFPLWNPFCRCFVLHLYAQDWLYTDFDVFVVIEFLCQVMNPKCS